MIFYPSFPEFGMSPRLFSCSRFHLLNAKMSTFGSDRSEQTPDAVHLLCFPPQKRMSKNRHGEVKNREQNEQSGTLGEQEREIREELEGVGVKRREQDLA